LITVQGRYITYISCFACTPAFLWWFSLSLVAAITYGTDCIPLPELWSIYFKKPYLSTSSLRLWAQQDQGPHTSTSKCLLFNYACFRPHQRYQGKK